jgi:predicted Na+-dependent transporter
LYFPATVLNFFGIIMFILGLLFTLFGLKLMEETKLRGFKNIFSVLFYMLVYLTVYPFLLLFAIGKIIKSKIIRKKIGWGTR